MKKLDQTVQLLLNEMTFEQKLAQLQSMFCGGQDLPPEFLERFPNGLGSIATITCKATIEEQSNEAKQQQDILVKNCGIPALRHIEALTGVLSPAGTVFPSAIGLGATWNPKIVQRMAEIIRDQMMSVGLRHALAPVMDVARDPRWGRVGETYGEDPTICSAMSVAYVTGLQTDDLSQGVLATAKHFLGYAKGEGGLNMASNSIPERELKEVYAKPFQAAITEAGLLGVMNSYGAIDGDMVISSHNILTKLLREEMGFEGIVVSDYMSINKLVDLGLAEDSVEAGKMALEAGLESELPMPYGYTDKLLERIKSDKKLEERLDEAVGRILDVKSKLGLFHNPAGREEMTAEAYNREMTGKDTLKAAQESIVLLKNDGILPLKKDRKKVAVIGPHADSIRLLFGCYTYPAALDRDTTGAMSDMPGMQGISQSKKNDNEQPFLPGSSVRASFEPVEDELKELYGDRTITILEAIRNKIPEAHITYNKGCDVAGCDRSGFHDAIEAARNADVAIVIGGGKYGWGGNCTTGEGIDCDRIGLPGIQEELAVRVAETGTPAIYIHMDIKPISSEIINEKYQAVLENWFPGESGGRAIADVLFGDCNPAGRLPITAPRNAGQIPIYASHKNGSSYLGNKGMVIAKYVEGEKTPLYYFGEGLSYSTFEYSDLKITEEVSSKEKVNVSCTVQNISNIDGEEVVQLYVSDKIASVLRPVQELVGFYRVFLKAGEKKEVHFSFKVTQLAFLDKNMKWIVEKGDMDVGVGSSSNNIRLKGKFRIADTDFIDEKNRGFYADTWEQSL